jgi:hypothetical protein
MISGFRNLDILDWEFEESDSSFMVHNACWFPAKLVPQIPAHLILNLFEAGDTVLDPFCGSGTTLIESLRHGRKCIGTDVNPVAIYISLAKCRFVGFEQLKSAQDRILAEFSRACTFLDNPKQSWLTGQVITLSQSLIEDPDGNIPNYEANRGWFHPVVLGKLGVLKALIWEEKPIVRNTLALTFFSILRDCSSLPIRKPYTYIADNVKPKREDLIDKDVFQIYRERSQKLLLGRKAYEDQCKLVMRETGATVQEFNQWFVIKKVDARNLSQKISNRIDCVVTSPPYMGVTDTTTAHRLWYLWHDFSSTLEEGKNVEIGARWKRKKPNLLEQYLEDLFVSFQQITGSLKDGGYLCLVIGEPERAKGKIIDRISHMMSNQLHLNICRTYRRTIHKKWFEHPTGGVAREDIMVFKKV